MQVSHEIISLVQPVAGTLMLLSSVDFDDANVCAVDPVVTHLEKISTVPQGRPTEKWQSWERK